MCLLFSECSPFANVPGLLSGSDTTANQASLNLVFDGSGGNTIASVAIDTFVEADCVVSIANGLLTISA